MIRRLLNVGALALMAGALAISYIRNAWRLLRTAR